MLYSSSQVGMDAGYFTLVSLLFSAISISISNIFRYYLYTIVIIIIHNIILSPLFSLSLPFFLEKSLLTESFRVSVTYLQTHTLQIANQPSLEIF